MLASADLASLNYYAYGDSVTAATGGDLAADGSDCYVHQMKGLYSITGDTGNSSDGAGMGSDWGLTNIEAHYDAKYDVFLLMFGSNDTPFGEVDTVSNLLSMATYLTTRGKLPLFLIGMTRYDEVEVNAYLLGVQEDLISAGHGVVLMYDSTDAYPYNTSMDLPNLAYYYNQGHPSKAGHTEMAKYMWSTLNAIKNL